MRRSMSTLISRQGTDLQNRPAVSEPAPIISPADADADCGGGEDCFYCACPETD
jgi:hypothetical protein